MSTSAIVMMIIGCVSIFGGLALSIGFAVNKTKKQT